MLELKNVVKKQGAQTVLQGLDASFADGKIYGVVTPDLTEKQMLVGMMTGITEIDGGQIIINGLNLKADPMHAKKRFGYLPYDAPLYPNMTVGEYLTYVAKLKGYAKKEIAQLVDEAEDKFGLSFYHRVMISNLLSETCQLLALAQAFIGMPRYILLDEPLHHLGPLQVMLVRKIIAACDASSVIIFSNHLNELARLCDEVLFVYKGKKVVMGDRDALIGYLSEKPAAAAQVDLGNVDAALSAAQKALDETEEVTVEEVENLAPTAREWASDETQEAPEEAQEAPAAPAGQTIGAARTDEAALRYADYSFEDLMEAVIVKIFSDDMELAPEEAEDDAAAEEVGDDEAPETGTDAPTAPEADVETKEEN